MTKAELLAKLQSVGLPAKETLKKAELEAMLAKAEEDGIFEEPVEKPALEEVIEEAEEEIVLEEINPKKTKKGYEVLLNLRRNGVVYEIGAFLQEEDQEVVKHLIESGVIK